MTHIEPSESITSIKQINGVKNVQVNVLLMYYYNADIWLLCVCHIAQT